MTLLRARGRRAGGAASAGGRTIVTATNVFAHIEDVHDIVEAILAMLDDDGVFITESHYLLALIETLQYDTIYHEHLRYYSLREPQLPAGACTGSRSIHAKRIPTHGGSIRVYAARAGHAAGAAERRAAARRGARGGSVGRSAQGVQAARGAVEAGAARRC